MKSVPLGDVATITLGYPFSSRDFVERGVRLLRGDNIGQGDLRWDGAAHWAEESPTDYLLRTGDVVLAMDRPWISAGLKFARVRESDLPCLLVQRVAALRAVPGVEQGFIEAVIRDPRFSAYVQSVQTGTAVPHISGRQIAEYPVWLPGFRGQRAIAEVLGALDDKIAANALLTTALDELGALTFAAMPRTESVPLSEVARFVNGRNFTKDATNGGRVVIRIAELNRGLGGSTVRNAVSAVPDNLATPGDLLFAWSGSLTVKRWFLEDGLVNQHIFKVIPKDGYPVWMVHQLLLSQLPDFRSIAADKATTMGHIQRRHLDAEVSLPSLAERKRQGALMEGLWRRALAAEVETVSLGALRDTLLPELMSGRLRVRDAERAVEDAL